jgi:hypothetical protein
MTDVSQQELDYYRAVEDFFAAVRGVPHTLSTKDFELLRSWWRERVPLSAVRSGIAEVFARRRERGVSEPIVSLQYCRHAVATHARKLAEMRLGAPSEIEDDTAQDRARRVTELVENLDRLADERRKINWRLAAVIDSIAQTIREAGDLPPTVLEEHLFALETVLLDGCFEILDDDARQHIEEQAWAEAEATSVTPEARARSFTAHRDRLLRELLSLPRLEL